MMLIAPKLETQTSLRGCLESFYGALIRHGVWRWHGNHGEGVKVDEHILIGCESPQFIGVLFKTRIRPKFAKEKSV